MPDELGGPKKGSLLWAAVVFEFALALIAVLVGWLVGVNPFHDLAWRDPRQLLVKLSWGGLAALPMLAVFLWARHSQWAPFRDLRRTVDEHLLGHFTGATPIELAWVALAAGFGEEVLFRGCLLQAFDVWLGNQVLGGYSPLVLSSLLFGLAHFASWTYLVVATFVGLYLGGLLVATGSLWPAVIAHALYDFVALWCLQSDYEKKRAT